MYQLYLFLCKLSLVCEYLALPRETLFSHSESFIINIILALGRYATGRVTGVVLDAGDGVTHAVPIYEGFAMPHSIMRVDIAGRDVTRHLRALIRKEGFNFRTTAEFEIVKAIKEKACYLATNPQKEETIETDKILYTLPDGNTIDVSPPLNLEIICPTYNYSFADRSCTIPSP